MAQRVWTGLGPAQADGLACVICGLSFGVVGSVCVPVGRSRTGSQVFACAGACAQRARELASPVGIPQEALTAAGAAFRRALEAAGADLGQVYPDDVVTAAVRAAAPLVVAAELRHLAEQIRDDAQGHRWLGHRADQLDPAGGGAQS